MIKKIWVGFFLIFILCECSSSKKIQKTEYEGFVVLSANTYKDVDENYNAIHEIDFINITNKFYIRGNYTISPNLMLMEKSNGALYDKVDTISYIFSDLKNQKTITFEKLHPTSKILEYGEINKDANFISNSEEYDIFNGVSDTLWQTKKVKLNNKDIIELTYIPYHKDDEWLCKVSKQWIDSSIKNFPIQLSNILSKKLNDGFVYKSQDPIQIDTGSSTNSIFVKSIEFTPAKLPDSIHLIFNTWIKKIEKNTKSH